MTYPSMRSQNQSDRSRASCQIVLHTLAFVFQLVPLSELFMYILEQLGVMMRDMSNWLVIP